MNRHQLAADLYQLAYEYLFDGADDALGFADEVLALFSQSVEQSTENESEK